MNHFPPEAACAWCGAHAPASVRLHSGWVCLACFEDARSRLDALAPTLRRDPKAKSSQINNEPTMAADDEVAAVASMVKRMESRSADRELDQLRNEIAHLRERVSESDRALAEYHGAHEVAEGCRKDKLEALKERNRWRSRAAAAEKRVMELEAQLVGSRYVAEPASNPVPMILHCPECRARHIDVGEFATKVHHTHSCQSCGLTWRPAVVPTVGVQFLPGFKNEENKQ